MKWISINDRLPKPAIEVLTTDGDTFNLATKDYPWMRQPTGQS
ncbi:Protein of unknown function [bacterium A37T11]|nr:Protein of unknown function [bacterium A37T11]